VIAPSNGHVQPAIIALPEVHETSDGKWDASITNQIPYEDLTKRVADWIFIVIGNKSPGQGAVFEIEAKVGHIFDEQAGCRLQMPIDTEAVFSKEKYRGRTSFQSSMDMVSLVQDMAGQD
jgi:hypothetical protein